VDSEAYVLQPVTRGAPSAEWRVAPRLVTYLGADCGPEGTGRWYSLSGLMEDKDDCLDLGRCYPLVRAEYQASCVGATIRARGAGSIRLELKSADGRVLWWGTEDLALGSDLQELVFPWDPASLRRVKSLHWAAEAGAQVQLDSLDLNIRVPRLSFEEELFLLSYAKLARLYSPGWGTVKERAPQAAGTRDSIAAAGNFCLATCVATKMGLVKQAQAEQILHKVRAAVSELPRASGLLPATVSRDGGRYHLPDGSLYSTLGTSLYYHSLMLAAQLLWDGKTLVSAIKEVREIDFKHLRDAEGYVVVGLDPDGRTPTALSWRDWGGEAALVTLLEHMATGEIRSSRPLGAGTVKGGVGLSAEIASLFYADFSTAEVDAVTGAGWLGARRALLQEQIGYFPRKHSKSGAARLGLYGLSVGEDPSGEGLIAGGTRTGDKQELIRPHYVLMSGLVQSRPEAAYTVLCTMKDRGLITPWGFVGGFTRDLEHQPLMGSFSAALECLAAYHLWAEVSGQTDHIYAAVEHCGLLREAVRAFYPPLRTW
jgi:hypothetical protein